MNRLKRLLLIGILIVAMIIVVIFSSLMIWGQFTIGLDFEKLGTIYIKTLIWMTLIIATLLSTLIDNLNALKKENKKRHEKYYDISDFELGFTIKMDFLKVFKISFNNTFKEPIFYLFIGIIVLPQFQDKSFLEPFNMVNVLTMIAAMALGMIAFSILHAFGNYIQTYGYGKELHLSISHQGLFFKDKRGLRHIPNSKIKKLNENDLFLILRINVFQRIYILKDLFDKTDLDKIRKNLT
ncbi:hypothetical protein [Carboxylicivirga marina]|uniref:DUF304 domain-containing protein n=1 Tax=Carboxylicivirga marina TaxID=2800988 RepID=A0ABS1HN86_9BACT|nr:hypothetical protein [Carboxylicivirga marina]MBK3519147.1 hypothetical protein [Carboxylicivirga marina]